MMVIRVLPKRSKCATHAAGLLYVNFHLNRGYGEIDFEGGGVIRYEFIGNIIYFCKLCTIEYVECGSSIMLLYTRAAMIPS